ncbi:alkaline serine protease P32 [Fusarium sp. NRRL 52700]|nr:alkaline serine protease P32 [Fusarium sp. NRRL 52700]
MHGASTQKNAPWDLARIFNELPGKDHTTYISGNLASMNFIVEDAATRKCPKGILANMPLSVASSPAINELAAGNDDTDASHVSPSNEPLACTVGAIAQNNRASLSNYGVSVDVFAPGVYTKSSWIKKGVKLESGTSLPTPRLTSLAAYLLGLKDIEPPKLCNLIESMSVKDVIKGISENTVNLLIQNSEAK